MQAASPNLSPSTFSSSSTTILGCIRRGERGLKYSGAWVLGTCFLAISGALIGAVTYETANAALVGGLSGAASGVSLIALKFFTTCLDCAKPASPSSFFRWPTDKQLSKGGLILFGGGLMLTAAGGLIGAAASDNDHAAAIGVSVGGGLGVLLGGLSTFSNLCEYWAPCKTNNAGDVEQLPTNELASLIAAPIMSTMTDTPPSAAVENTHSGCAGLITRFGNWVRNVCGNDTRTNTQNGYTTTT